MIQENIVEILLTVESSNRMTIGWQQIGAENDMSNYPSSANKLENHLDSFQH